MSDATETLTKAATPEWGTMSHKQLCRRMALWLKNARNYSVVITERSTSAMETPDVLGFHAGRSLLIECKVSRADFLSDREKSFRAYAERGMGDLRYFAAPRGIIKPEDLPANWGLLEVSDRQVREIVEATDQPANKKAEVLFLVSAIRRLEIACAVFVRHEDEPAACPMCSLTPDLCSCPPKR